MRGEGEKRVRISEKKSRGKENKEKISCTRIQEEEQMGLIGHK